MKQIKIIFVTVLVFSSILLSQERMILRTNGEQIKLSYKKDLREAVKGSHLKINSGKKIESHFIRSNNRSAETIDTLGHRWMGGIWDINFGFFSQDVMMMWFEAPADMTIKAIGFTCSDDDGYINDGATVGLRLVKLNWTKEKLKNSIPEYQGYYPSVDNSDFFGENANGNWISKDINNPLPPWTNHENPDSNTFNYDLFSDNGSFFPVIPVKSNADNPVYNWLEINTTGLVEPVILRGDIFAIVAINNGVNLDSSRIGFWSDNIIGYYGWKYYKNGIVSPEESGWWIKPYTWDFALVVDFPCPPPYINITQPLLTTFSTEPRTVCAEIEYDTEYHGTSDSVDIELVYILNYTDTNKVQMSSSDNYNYCADIPGQSPDTHFEYWVQFTDKFGKVFTSGIYKYFIFKPVSSNLLVFNGFLRATGIPQNYYFGTGDAILEWDHDTWAYGPLTKDLVDNYKNILEICTTGPTNLNNDVIREWLENSPSNNYFLAGQEWLGAGYNFIDQDFTEGSFEYDILGITHSYNDVSFDGTSGQELPSRIIPQQSTFLGGPMFDLAEELNAADTVTIDSILYDPVKELGINNWLDGFDVREDDSSLEVFMKAKTRGIAGIPEIREVNIGVSRKLNAGNKIVFMSYDPLSINSIPTDYWFGFSEVASQVQSLYWFDIKPGVYHENNLLNEFVLYQNYPNPFNPSTKIKYSIPRYSGQANIGSSVKITLKIYDILGREVATLVNKEQSPGNYEVQFNTHNLSSGVYYYRLISDSYNQTKKMLLIK